MGARVSTLSDEDIDAITAATIFTPNEIKRLFRRFQGLDKDGKGSISSEEFMSIPELAMNPLVSRVVAIFDSEHSDSVNFQQFAEVLSVFKSDPTQDPNSAQNEKKIRFTFRIYDIDEDGFISATDLLGVLKLMVGTNINEEQLQVIVTTTIAEADLDRDGKISYEEFSALLHKNNTDVDRKLSIRF